MIRSEPSRARRACGRNNPCVSEIRPIVLGFRSFVTMRLCNRTLRFCSAPSPRRTGIWLIAKCQPKGWRYIGCTEQVWPGRAILEYDSWIQGFEGCGPNFNFFDKRFNRERCAGQEHSCNEHKK